ncbi:allatostatin-A receptor-like [Actinia tenebrosa]|uniref:Allatostatin-A receptor-like n=1 Tax=Actinia tenebrosa TaxID=6105 RepID=A0A6P8I9L8_ACTTE|nr:allatostatin-A receptor-like [Actinia tenebrosa]
MKAFDFSDDFIPFLFALILLSLAIASNSMVVAAVRKKRFLRSTTNYLLVNLAVADIVNAIFLPFMLIQRYVRFEKGILADFLCKFFIYYHVPVTASIVSTLTLVVLSVERYHAIVKPMRTVGIRLRKDTVKYAIVAVWISAIILTLPLYISGYYDTTTKICLHNSDKTFQQVFVYSFNFIVTFLPFIIITFCYFQIVRELYFKNKVAPQNIAAQQDALNKRKIVKLSISVTTAFVLCFFPLAITISLTTLDSSRFPRKYSQTASVLYFAQTIINPFLYAFQSTNFRRAFKLILSCRQ